MRINKVNLVIGRRGTGKTTYIRNIIKIFRQVHKSTKIIVCDTLDHPIYRDFTTIKPEDIKKIDSNCLYRTFSGDTELILNETEKLYNALVIYEDASKYIGTRLSDTTRKMIFDTKQKNVDMIFLFHGFYFVAPELLRVVDNIILFKSDNPVLRKSIIPNYDEVEKAYHQLESSKDPYLSKMIKIY